MTLFHILGLLCVYKINPLIHSVIKQSMSLWRTTLSTENSIIRSVKIQCGIFQGDSMSPLLFCLAMNPLSETIKSTAFGYTVKSGHLIQHLLYMDDLKLYARNKRDLNALITTVSLFSNDIGMTINVAKSAKLIVCRGKVVSTPDFVIDKLGVITDVSVSKGYKYLGLLQDILAIKVTVKSTSFLNFAHVVVKYCLHIFLGIKK